MEVQVQVELQVEVYVKHTTKIICTLLKRLGTVSFQCFILCLKSWLNWCLTGAKLLRHGKGDKGDKDYRHDDYNIIGKNENNNFETGRYQEEEDGSISEEYKLNLDGSQLNH